jgi:hypothetical protein
MNARHFRDFKFSKIFLFNQSVFNKNGNLKKCFFPLTKRFANNKKLLEFEAKNIDYIRKKLMSQEYYETENNKEKQILTTPNKNNNIKLIRTKILRNNKALQKVDFNINNTSNELNDDSLELNNNRYFSLRKKNVKLPLTIIKSKGKINHSRNKQNSITNKSNDSGSPDIKLPNIQYNAHLRSINTSSSLNKIVNNILEKDKKKEAKKSEEKNNDKNDNNNNNNNNSDKAKKKEHRDIFKNVNYFIDNKKTQLKVNDIQRNIYEINNDNENEGENENKNKKKKSSQIFINTKIPNYNEQYNIVDEEDKLVNVDNNIYNEDAEILKIKEKYILYEKNKKYIEKNKIYDTMKYGAAMIPNLTLDKDFQNIKLFESNVLNMKKTKTDLPVFFRTKQIN